MEWKDKKREEKSVSALKLDFRSRSDRSDRELTEDSFLFDRSDKALTEVEFWLIDWTSIRGLVLDFVGNMDAS